MTTPEQQARVKLDTLLQAAGWVVQDRKDFNRKAALGVAVRELQLAAGPCDYLLFLDGKAAGVIEAKKSGVTLSGVAEQSSYGKVSLEHSVAQKHAPGPGRAGPLAPPSIRLRLWTICVIVCIGSLSLCVSNSWTVLPSAWRIRAPRTLTNSLEPCSAHRCVSWGTLRCLPHRLRNIHEMLHALRTHPPAFAGFLRASV